MMGYRNRRSIHCLIHKKKMTSNFLSLFWGNQTPLAAANAASMNLVKVCGKSDRSNNKPQKSLLQGAIRMWKYVLFKTTHRTSQMDGHELSSVLFFRILKALEKSDGPYFQDIWGFEAQMSFHSLRLGMRLKNTTMEWSVHIFKCSQHGHDDQSRTSQHKPTVSQAGSKPIISVKVCK